MDGRAPPEGGYRPQRSLRSQGSGERLCFQPRASGCSLRAGKEKQALEKEACSIHTEEERIYRRMGYTKPCCTREKDIPDSSGIMQGLLRVFTEG